MKYIFLICTAYLYCIAASAQTCNFSLAGHVEDTDTKEKLAAATVLLKEQGRQIITDNNGDFVFDGLCEGTYTVIISHVDCETAEQKIVLNKNLHIDIDMPHLKNILKDVTIESVIGTPNTGFKKDITGRQLEQLKGQSLSEALSKINGVTMLQTGNNVSKPVIHGLHSNRILTINNGVRQEGQQWGNEHAPEIDPFIADRLTVIKGVDELKYGSDAIGGVILVETKPLRGNINRAGEINTGYFTNNKMFVLSGQYEQALKKINGLRFRLQGTFKKGATVQTPNYRLNNTGNEEINFSATAAYKKNSFATELFYSQFSTQAGIFTGAHIGNLTDLQNAIAAGKPDEVYLGQTTYTISRPRQEVTHRLLKSKSSYSTGGHNFSLLLSMQYNDRKEFDIVRNASNTSPQMQLNILTLSQELTWEHPRKRNFTGMAGISALQQDNSYNGRYFIPNYRSYSYGGYYIEKWNRHQWELQGGIRFDHKNINTERLRFGGDTINNSFRFNTLAASFNSIFKPSAGWRFNVNISLANRAPHVNELLSDGIHHGTATYEQGNIYLKPEQSFNINTGIQYHDPSNTVSAEVTLYRNNIRNFIFQRPVPDSPVLTIAGAFPKTVYQQTDAVLSGLDVSIIIKPVAALELNTKASFLRAKNKVINDWLIWMPADRFSSELVYNFADGSVLTGSYISTEVQHVLKQTRIPDENKFGKQDYKAAPGAYTLLTLNASGTFTVKKQPFIVSIGIRNLLNTVYRDYLNSFRYFTDEMGRNISIRLKIPFIKYN